MPKPQVVEESCGNCKYWQLTEGCVGHCLAHPPLNDRHIHVCEEFWCGEWTLNDA